VPVPNAHGELTGMGMRSLRGAVRQGGQTMVEFALVLPVLMVLLLGLIQAHLYWTESAAVDHAAVLGVLAAAGASPERADQPDIAGAYRIAAGQIKDAGLHVSSLSPVAPTFGSTESVCPPPSDQWPTGVIYICIVSLPGEHAVRLTAEGWIPAYVPPTFGLKAGWRTGALLISSSHYLHATYFTA
jgi:hypothetical protein